MFRHPVAARAVQTGSPRPDFQVPELGTLMEKATASARLSQAKLAGLRLAEDLGNRSSPQLKWFSERFSDRKE